MKKKRKDKKDKIKLLFSYFVSHTCVKYEWVTNIA